MWLFILAMVMYLLVMKLYCSSESVRIRWVNVISLLF